MLLSKWSTMKSFSTWPFSKWTLFLELVGGNILTLLSNFFFIGLLGGKVGDSWTGFCSVGGKVPTLGDWLIIFCWSYRQSVGRMETALDGMEMSLFRCRQGTKFLDGTWIHWRQGLEHLDEIMDSLGADSWFLDVLYSRWRQGLDGLDEMMTGLVELVTFLGGIWFPQLDAAWATWTPLSVILTLGLFCRSQTYYLSWYYLWLRGIISVLCLGSKSDALWTPLQTSFLFTWYMSIGLVVLVWLCDIVNTVLVSLGRKLWCSCMFFTFLLCSVSSLSSIRQNIGVLFGRQSNSLWTRFGVCEQLSYLMRMWSCTFSGHLVCSSTAVVRPLGEYSNASLDKLSKTTLNTI